MSTSVRPLVSETLPVNELAGVPTEIAPCQRSPSKSSVNASLPVARFASFLTFLSDPLSFGCVVPVFFSKAAKPLAIFLIYFIRVSAVARDTEAN